MVGWWGLNKSIRGWGVGVKGYMWAWPRARGHFRGKTAAVLNDCHVLVQVAVSCCCCGQSVCGSEAPLSV